MHITYTVSTVQYVESYTHMASSDGQNNLLRNPSIRPPAIKDFEEINKDLGLRLTDQELQFLVEYHKETTESYERVNELLEDPLPVKYPRTAGHRETENPAWYWRCDIKGAPSGVLAGKTVAIKDNIAVAGVPMMNGSKMFEGYTPEFDATIVTRILDAGGHIMGKATCEDMCISGSSWISCSGLVPNPYDPTRTAGGSSSGSASLVAHNVVDMAIGGDQAGSIRIPACWCGIVGLKPSFGLVPYTGICPIEIGLDHIGPMARTVTDCARLLEAIAGYDEGRDVRQHPAMTIPKYYVQVEGDVSKKVVGILKEGFKDVQGGYAKVVKEATERFKECGVAVKEVSMPLHDDGINIWTPIAHQGLFQTMVQGNGGGYNWKGIHARSMQEFLAARRNLRPGDQSIVCKSIELFSEYINRNYQNKFYSKAQNLRWKLSREYDKILKECDVLVMPTLTGLPFKLPTKDNSLADLLRNPSIYPPTIKDFEEINKDLGLRLTEQEVKFLVEYHKETIETYERVNELLEDPLPVKYPRTPGHRETENPAWYWRCDIKGAPSGVLVGKTIAIKDNIAVAGVPMMNGSKMLEGYTPAFDATIVTRILDAGGHIMGKANCEDMCFSGSSWTSCSGLVPNPYDPTRTTGGSSSGCASLVAHGVVDMAIGGDQGGSIRTPACFCGIVGLKPSFGLVPYTGICPIEIGIDHTGPMTRTVTDCARLLEAIAGYDEGRDVRQHPAMTIPKYSVEVESDVSKKVVGILKEGFKDVAEGYAKVVKDALERFNECGITVKEVSMPLHDDGLAIWTPIGYEGTYKTMIQGNGGGYSWKGIHARSMQEFLAAKRNLRPGDQAITCKSVELFSEYMDRNYQNKFYSKAQNLTWKLTREYDKLLKECDVFVMPTLTALPFKLPTKDDPLAVVFKKSFSMMKNTAPFDVTGHPAITINAGFCDGLPCGMMIVGRMFDDLTVLQVARAFEKLPKEKLIHGLGFLFFFVEEQC